MARDIRIRRFKAEDLPTLHRIREAAYAPVFRSFRDIVGPEIAPVALAGAEAEQGAHLDDLARPDAGSNLHVVERDGGIVGFFCYTLDPKSKVGEIGLNAVHPDHDGRGIGTAMYEFALAQMKAAGMMVATVGTGGDPSHAPARAAYAKAGFGPGIPNHYLYRML